MLLALATGGLRGVQIFDEDYFIAALVEKHLIGESLNPEESITAGAHALLLADFQVLQRIAGIRHGGVRNLREIKAAAGILNLIQNGALESHVADADAA